MLKGVCRQIVEIRETGSPYFERAWLVVRVGCVDWPESLLQKEGRQLLRHADPHTGLRLARRRRWLVTLLSALAAGGGGVLAGFFLFR